MTNTASNMTDEQRDALQQMMTSIEAEMGYYRIIADGIEAHNKLDPFAQDRAKPILDAIHLLIDDLYRKLRHARAVQQFPEMYTIPPAPDYGVVVPPSRD